MNNKKPFSSKEFRAIYSKVHRLCVDLVIKTPKGLVLTLRDIEPQKGKWHLPGGTVHYREKLADAITRVARTELSSKVKIKEFLGYMEFPNEAKDRGFGSTVSLAFLCFSDGETLKPDEQSSEIRTFNKLPPNLIKEQSVFLRSVWRKIR